MIYLLDANVLITANNNYYPIDQVPEFWDWLCYQGEQGNIKMPTEIIDEVLAGTKKDDLLLDWTNNNKDALHLKEEAQPELIQRVVRDGYAPDLTDDEIVRLGRDPFLVAYALSDHNRSVVTTEISAPSKQRHNRKIPDVCDTFAVPCYNTFSLNRLLKFRTMWKNSI